MKKLERKLKKGDPICVIDALCWSVAERPTHIKNIDENTHTFSVEFVDCFQTSTLYTYSFDDYGYLFFETKEEAKDFVSKMPMYHQILYRVFGSKVYERIVEDIYAKHTDGIYNVYISLNKGKDLSIKEFCNSLFFSSDYKAREYVSSMKKK